MDVLHKGKGAIWCTFHDKGTHILSTGIQCVPSTQYSGATYYLLRVLAMLSSSLIIFFSAIEIGPYSLHRKRVISALKLNKKIVRFQYSFPRKKRWFVSRKPSRLEKATILNMLCMCTRSWARANDAKLCAVGMRNAILGILGNDLKTDWILVRSGEHFCQFQVGLETNPA